MTPLIEARGLTKRFTGFTALSGIDLAVRLRAVHPEAKVLYMSGYTDESVIRHGVWEGEVNFVQKPFTLEMLGRRVREVLDHHS